MLHGTGRAFRFDADVAADIGEAEVAITKLNVEARALCDTEALARLMLRAECVASSRIEGLQISARRLLRAENAQHFGNTAPDVTADEILGNIDAIVHAIGLSRHEPISKKLLIDCHRRLFKNSALHSPGDRCEINKIGSVEMFTYYHH